MEMSCSVYSNFYWNTVLNNWLLLYVESILVMSRHILFDFFVYSKILFVIVFCFDWSSCIYF